MPSTGWNLFVASGVALVVYIAARAEMVLLGLIAGTLTFVVGWLLGYAINQELLDSMELSRIVGAGSVTVFAIVWTLLYSQEEYLLGLIVVCLAWFAAWFTSSMGPIKGNTGAMATIDEPRPPAGSDPEGPIDLGGPDEPVPDNGGGFLSSLFSFGTDEPREPEGYPADERAGPRRDDDSFSEPVEPSRPTTDTDSAESIFGLGIFYEGDPDEPSAGAEDGGPTSSTGADGDGRTQPNAAERRSADGGPTNPPEQGAEPAATDRTRPTATGPKPDSRDSDSKPDGSPPDQTPIDEAALDPPVEEGDGPRTSSSTGPADRGENGDDPPEDHRVDVDDDSGFIFG